MSSSAIRLLEAGRPSSPPRLLAILSDESAGLLVEALRDSGVVVETVGDLEQATARSRCEVDVLVCTLATAGLVLDDEPRLVTAGLAGASLVLLVDAAALDGAAALIEHGVFDCVALPRSGAELSTDAHPSSRGELACRAELVEVIARAAAHHRRAELDHRRDVELADRRSRLEQRRNQLAGRVQQLELADEPQRKLTQLVVHDLKNQISVVRSNLGYVLDEPLTPQARPRLQNAADAVEPVLQAILELNPAT